MYFHRWRLSYASLLFLLMLTNVAFAQEDAGQLEGRVVKDGEGVSAVVVLVNELKLTEITNHDGSFSFGAVPAGRYTLIFTRGDNSSTRDDVFVTAGRTRHVELAVEWDLGVSERVVVSAVARAAKIVDAPAAVTTIPDEQIERQASHGQVPKVLEFTPGAEVTQSGLYDFNFNTRGFNSSLNRRVSTYIDGRDVGVVLLGAQEWASIAGGLDDVANLEFIRGPSAALYGANASSGVVNITTKPPADSLGGFVRLSAGELESRSVDFRFATSMKRGWYAKFLGGFKNSGDFSVSRNSDLIAEPEYSEFCLLVGETDCLPPERSLFREQNVDIHYGLVRFDKLLSDGSGFTFETGVSSIQGPVLQTGIGRVQNLASRRPFYRFAFSSDHWNLLGHYSSRRGTQANLTQALVTDFELITDTRRYGVEAQGNWGFDGGKGRFVIGGAYTEERVDTTDPATGRQTVVYRKIATNRQAIFSQLDYRLNDHIKFVAAGRIDKSTLHDTQFSPKAAMVYSINEKNSLRFTYNQAFQVANYSEFFLHTRISTFPLQGFITLWCESPQLERPIDCDSIDVDEFGFVPILAVGNDDLELEKTKAWEIGYSGLLANRVFLTVDYYNANNKNFITDLVPQVGTILGNTDGCIDTEGNPLTDPTLCPINNDYRPWVGPADWESTFLIDPLPPPFGDPPRLAAVALRNSVEGSVGGDSLGFRLAQDLDGSTVVIGRTYANIGEVDTQGVDLGIQYFVNEAWNLQASYSWFDFEIFDSDPRVAEILLPNSPEHKASLSVSFSKNRWTASLGGRWVKGFRWSAGVFQGDVGDYSTIDLAVTCTFNERVRLGLNVANLRDSLHRQTFGGDLLRRRALLNLTFDW